MPDSDHVVSFGYPGDDMAYERAVLCMHGMGNLKETDFRKEIAQLTQALAERLSASQMAKIYIPPAGIFYSEITQDAEDKVWDKMSTDGGLDTGIIRHATVNKLRQFILSGFSDATAFTGFNGAATEQQYVKAQNKIRDALVDIYKVCGKTVPVVIISQSLGSQILSNYLWDAQVSRLPRLPGQEAIKTQGDIWTDYHPAADIDFLQLTSLTTWFSTGCNIPVFVSGFKNVRAVHNRQYGYQFDWINYFDYDDVLGYPLKPLGVLFEEQCTKYGQSYSDAVMDIQVNASAGVTGAVLASWNPWSHTQYWRDKTVLDALADALSV